MPDFFSDDLKDLMDKMLKVDYSERITLLDLLRHPWLNQKTGSYKFTPEDNNEDYVSVVNNLKKYRGESKLKGACMNLLVKQISSSKIDQLKLQFQQVDKDSSGMIDKTELQEILTRIEFEISDSELDMLFSQQDYANNN